MADDLPTALKSALIDFLSPLGEAAGDPQTLAVWLETLGQTTAISGDPALLQIVQNAAALIQQLKAMDADALESFAGVEAVLSMGQKIADLQSELRQFALDPARGQAAEGLAEEVVALLFASYLRRRHPIAFRVASLLTVIDARETSALEPAVVQNGVTLRYPRVLDTLHFDMIGALLSRPGDVLKAAYFPNQLATGADAWSAAARLFPNLSYLADQMGVGWRIEYRPSVAPPPQAPNDGSEEDIDLKGDDFGRRIDTDDPAVATDVDSSSSDASEDTAADEAGGSSPVPLPDGYYASYFPGFRLVVLSAASSSGGEVALEIQCSSSSHPGLSPGYIVSVLGTFDAVTTFDLWRLTLTASGQIPAFVLKPSGFGLVSTAVPLTGGGANILLDRLPDPARPGPVFLLGSATGTRLEIGTASVEADLSYAPADIAAGITAKVSKCSFVLKPGDGDSFLKSVLPANGLSADFDLGMTLSSDRGLTIAGAAGLETTIPIDSSAGGFAQIQSLHVAVGVNGTGVQAELSASASLSVGPIQAVIDRMGVLGAVTFPSDGGNLGPLDLDLAFKPPSGVGLSVDVAGLVGGGFIGHDPAKHEYAGMLQLGYQSYKLLAFGLLSTVLPTGPGYSLVVMVDAEFPPIQLGLGFTLAGAGGMLGIHRTASIDALRGALTAHTLSNLLFPKHPIENAPELLTELDTLFPPADGRFVFGPIVRIGWGTPALLTLDLALVLELPAPVRLILISELTAVLPKPDAVLVEIHLSALGTIDFGKSEGALDAVLHDSRLLRFVLHGAMALRVTWAGNKTFLLAVGGTHPKFQLPPGFPKLDRLGISLASGSIAKLNLDGYLAITSNTLQIGAHVDLFVGVDGFGIAGFLTFDTLIQRHPFHFDGDISGAVTLSVSGHDVMALKMEASLTGPAPWHAAGSVTFDVLWWSVTKSFSATFGDSGLTELLDQIDVGQLLRDALGDARSFSATLAADVSALVTLIAPVTATTTVAAHPGAGLSVHQTVVPLGLTISQYGGGVPAGETLFAITSVSAGGAEQHEPPPVFDDFAPAQFLSLGDDERLASPSFERLAAGVEIAAPTTFGAAVVRPIAYETWFVDTREGLPRQEDESTTPLPIDHLTAVLLDGAVGRSSLARGGSQRYAGPRRAVMPAEVDFVVATSEQLTSSGVGAPAGQSYSQARAALDAELELHPERRGELLVSPRYEVSP